MKSEEKKLIEAGIRAYNKIWGRYPMSAETHFAYHGTKLPLEIVEEAKAHEAKKTKIKKCWDCGEPILGTGESGWHCKNADCSPEYKVAKEKARARARAMAKANCKHDWYPESHEEDRCTKCGEWKFTPDL